MPNDSKFHIRKWKLSFVIGLLKYSLLCLGCGSQPGSTGGGFWTGAATGGILGYMFGSRK